MKNPLHAVEKDPESFYTVFLNMRLVGIKAMLDWMFRLPERILWLLAASSIEKKIKSSVLKMSLEKRALQDRRLADVIQPLGWYPLASSAPPKLHETQVIEELLRSLKRSVLEDKAPLAKNSDELYVQRDSEYEDFSRFITSKSTHQVVVVGQSGAGKSWFIWEKMRASQNLANYMQIQRMSPVTCNGIVLEGAALTALIADQAAVVHDRLAASIESRVRERFIKHFMYRSNAGWIARMDTNLHEVEEHERKDGVEAYYYVAAAALLYGEMDRIDTQIATVEQSVAFDPEMDPLSRLDAIARQFHALGLDDLDEALRHVGIASTDWIFWCDLYARWFEAEQPLLVLDQVEQLSQKDHATLVEAFLTLSARLASEDKRWRHPWKAVLALRGETVERLRHLLSGLDATWIVLGEHAEHLPEDALPLCNPTTPDFIFEIVERRLRSLADNYRADSSTSVRLVCAAETLEETWRGIWHDWTHGSTELRASLARRFGSASIRSEVMDIFAACINKLYEEHRVVRSFTCEATAPKVFISYARRDEVMLKRLHAHLARFRRDHRLDWYDREVCAGGQWSCEVSERINQCTLFIALVSEDYLASEYCYQEEMQRAIALSHANRLRIIPIILEPCLWSASPLRQFQALPVDGKSMNERSNPDAAFHDVADVIFRCIDDRPARISGTPGQSTAAARLRKGDQCRLPMVTFDQAVESFMCGSIFSEAWEGLEPCTKSVLCSVGARLEPIVQISPESSPSVLVGFECLALGACGESLSELVEKCAALDPGVLRVCLSIAALETIGSLHHELIGGMDGGASDLQFTLNLDSALLSCPLLRPLLMRYQSVVQRNVIFEINENTSAGFLKQLKNLHVDFGLRFSADDLNNWNADVRRQLVQRIVMTRVDRNVFECAMSLRDESPQVVMRALQENVMRGRPLIVEGIDDVDCLEFLRRYWDPEKGVLCGRGYQLEPGRQWDSVMCSLKQFGFPGGNMLRRRRHAAERDISIRGGGLPRLENEHRIDIH